MAGKYLRGALISYLPTFLIPMPNVIIFQYNPETMTHTWTPASGLADEWGRPESVNPLAVKGAPDESFSFTLAMDANDMIADGSPVAEGLAIGSGIYSRLAALERLLYQVPAAKARLIGSVSLQALGIVADEDGEINVPEATVPTVLFVWGAGRVVPVRVTSLTITEKLYDALLNPTQAEAQIELRVLTPQELEYLDGPLRTIARGAYTYTQGLRETLAAANLENAVESVIGMVASLGGG